MRPTLIAITCLALLAGCSSAPEPESEPQSDPQVGELIEFEVFGIDCPGCHGGLENLAMEIPGVSAAKASWQDQKLVLEIEEGTEVTDDQVHDAINRANFTAGERLK